MPETIRKNMEVIQQSQQYGKLIDSIANWYALMELCEDLIERVKLYGISQYLDESAAFRKLEKNWCIIDDEDDKVSDDNITQANCFFTNWIGFIFNNVSDFLQQLGVVTAARGAFTKTLFGYALVNPGFFVSALLSTTVIKIGAEHIQSSNVLEHVDQVAEHF